MALIPHGVPEGTGTRQESQAPSSSTSAPLPAQVHPSPGPRLPLPLPTHKYVALTPRENTHLLVLGLLFKKYPGHMSH